MSSYKNYLSFLVAILVIISFFCDISYCHPIFAMPIRGRIPLRRSHEGNKKPIAELIKTQANNLLSSAMQGDIFIDQGRQSLLLLMAKNSNDLNNNLANIKKFYIGNKLVSQIFTPYVNSEQRYLRLKQELLKYISTKKPEYFSSADSAKTANFAIIELIYALARSFNRLAHEQVYEEPLLNEPDWQIEPLSAQSQAFIAFEPMREAILTVSLINEEILKNTKTQEVKTLVTESKVYFNFESTNVSFYISYAINGKGRARVFKTLL